MRQEAFSPREQQIESAVQVFNLSPDLKQPSVEELSFYQSLIGEAKNAYTNPVDSGFNVKAAASARLENDEVVFVSGGNKELKGKNFAYIHGETSAVSRLRDQYGNVPITAVGFYLEGDLVNGPNLTPCGPCRDVLRQECEPESLILNGNEKQITVRKFKDLFFSNYKAVDPESIDGRGVISAKRAIEQAVTLYLPEEEKENVYGVALVGEYTKNWSGSFFTTTAFGAVHPGVASILNWINSTDYAEAQYFRGDLDKIVVVGKNSIPELSYTDRQSLAEFDEILRSVSHRKNALPVELIHTNDKSKIIDAAVSDTEEMLPNRFGPGSLGVGRKDLANQIHKFFPRM